MHIQKSSAYSASATAQLGKGSSVVDLRPKRKNQVNPSNRPLGPQHHQAADPHPHAGQKLARTGNDRIKVHSIDERRPLAVHPRLDRKTQSALHAYESLQYQNEKDERESISRLLGVDLYV